MKSLLLALLLIPTVSFSATHHKSIDTATQHLIKAERLFRTEHPIEAAKEDLEVFKINGLPDEVYSAAYLLMGNIGLTTKHFDVSEVSYNRILKMKNAPALDKRAARRGLLLVGDLKKDQEAPYK